jgi:thymidylate synthase
MVLFDPERDFAESRDIPCNNWLHWLIRDGRLHLDVAVRSNDIVWGFSGINTFEWSVAQQMMAYWTDSEVGTAAYFISSLHLYERHFARAERMVARAGGRTLYDFGFAGPRFTTPLAALDATLARWFAAERRLREAGGAGGAAEGELAAFEDDFLRTCLAMLAIYNQHLAKAPAAEVARLVEALPAGDFKVAAIEYLARAWKDRSLIRLTPQEREFFDDYWGR